MAAPAFGQVPTTGGFLSHNEGDSEPQLEDEPSTRRGFLNHNERRGWVVGIVVVGRITRIRQVGNRDRYSWNCRMLHAISYEP